jgi:acyl-coenzyme A thioesterase PaaI-like protein|tara:strand:+ start:61 stop:480 length:420 start_codon:yes stop_codon:yes gene_type:complete
MPINDDVTSKMPGDFPPFLEILGLKNIYSEDTENFVCEFCPSEDLTHSNGAIVQGGFVTGMLDACMAQFLIYSSGGKMIPLTLDIDVKFFYPCGPGDVKVVSKITKSGKSICFTEAKLYQNDVLVASSTATNKLVPANF